MNLRQGKKSDLYKELAVNRGDQIAILDRMVNDQHHDSDHNRLSELMKQESELNAKLLQ